MIRDHRCEHHTAETPLHACTAVRVRKYHSEGKESCHSHINTKTIFELAAVHDMAADYVDAPRRNFKADSAAPWQRAPPLHRVKVVPVRAAWLET